MKTIITFGIVMGPNLKLEMNGYFNRYAFVASLN